MYAYEYSLQSNIVFASLYTTIKIFKGGNGIHSLDTLVMCINLYKQVVHLSYILHITTTFNNFFNYGNLLILQKSCKNQASNILFFNKHIKMVIPFWKQKFLKYFVSPCFNKNLLGFVVIYMHTVTSAQKICTCSKDRCIPLLVLYICCEDIKEFLDPVNFFLNL